jgi:hypothetical protein
MKSQSNKNLFRAILGFATVVTAAVLGWVIYTMAQDYVSWMNATAVIGTIVDAKPEGPFPDDFIVEYYMPDEKRALATVPSQYTTVREIGQDLELVYRKENPSVAMTKLQSRDHFSSISMNWLVFTIPLFSLELALLFPKYFSRWKR